MATTIVLGNEHDETLRADLVAALKSLGAVPLSSDWAVVGSQELTSFIVSLRGEVLKVESETYIGLSISGPEEEVAEVASSVSARKAKGSAGV